MFHFYLPNNLKIYIMSGRVISVFVFLNVIFLLQNVAATSTRGRVESCPGCSLNRLHEVKKFIFDDLPKYSGIEFKKIQGAPPELVILDELDEEIERIPLRDLDRKQCNELLVTKGFKLKIQNKSDL